jgi:hypothetical protein
MGKFSSYLGKTEYPYMVYFSKKLGAAGLHGDLYEETVSCIKHDFIKMVNFESYKKGPNLDNLTACPYTYQKLSYLNGGSFCIFFYASTEIDFSFLCLNDGIGTYTNGKEGDFNIHIIKITDKVYPDQQYTHPEEIAFDVIFWYNYRRTEREEKKN